MRHGQGYPWKSRIHQNKRVMIEQAIALGMSDAQVLAAHPEVTIEELDYVWEEMGKLRVGASDDDTQAALNGIPRGCTCFYCIGKRVDAYNDLDTTTE